MRARLYCWRTRGGQPLFPIASTVSYAIQKRFEKNTHNKIKQGDLTMTKSKKLVSRMMFALLVLTLVSFCFLGSTFARYTSGGTGSATVSIAKWSVTGTFEGASDTAVDMGQISPNKDAYPTDKTAYDANSARKNTTTTPIKVLTIKNESDVDALISLTVGDITATISTLPSGTTLTNAQVKAHFTVVLCDTSGNALSGDALKLAAKTESTTAQLEVYATITWTSDISATVFGTAADDEDTLIGQYVTALNFNINYTAVQNSTLPTAA